MRRKSDYRSAYGISRQGKRSQGWGYMKPSRGSGKCQPHYPPPRTK